MQTYIAILRGINVSGHKLIKMDALRKLFDSMGFKNTKTYIQSGNVVFQGKQAKTQDLEKKIASSILKEFSFEVPVLVKDANELEVVLKNNPFINKRKEDVTKLHVTFLSAEPEKANIDKIKEGNYAADEFIITGKTVYLFCPNGYGNTKLSNTFFENKLKVTATTRNWKTINELVTMAAELV
ncbi:MAG TPA: DUF1697 domain-containing protein [Bacteroidia bacterium]|nr:DUF1697 domain-containing protein [Bacteroidia bacterium]